MSQATDLISVLASDRSIMSGLRERAAAAGRSVVFAEGEDERVAAAALAMRELGLARPILVGDPASVRAVLAAQGADPGAIEILNPADRAERVELFLLERRAKRGLQQVEAKRFAGSSSAN